MADQTILQETLDNNIVDGDWLIYWKTSTGVQRRVARSSLLGATLTGAGTIATGGFTLTVPATGTAALKTGTPVANNVAQWDDANTVEDAGFAASNVALLDGSRSLTADWDIGDNRRVKADGVRARDGAGLRLEDDAGSLGVFVEDGGQVGIGTTTPTAQLDVSSGPINVAVNHGNLLSINNTVWTQPLVMRSQYDPTNGDSVDLLVPSAAANTANLRLTSAGRVGIGTTTPTAQLDVSSGPINVAVNHGNLLSINNTVWTQPLVMRSQYDPTNLDSVDLLVPSAAANTANLRLTSAGRVGIGTTTPGATLDVDQSSATAAIPTLHLRQADDDEEFIRFEATVGANSAIDTAALGSYYGKIRVNVDGVGDKFIALYNS